MIAFVKGTVSAVFVDSAVVDVGGVGVLVMCTPAALATLRVGDEATLATSMVVREDSLTLFGFADYDERSLFELLQTASGVGPKLAQAMLAVHGPDELRRAVMTEDLVALCKVPGIGRKGAQRIVLELKDRVGAPAGGAVPTHAPARVAADGWRDQVRAGLLGLGWSVKEAEAAVDAVAPMAAEALSDGETAPVAELLRAALQSLSRA
ncbi:MAG TPA: Holliday junction branch migration protein RuvA [Nocardioidaceae bacterium]|jgi:Holliday junction DNA helicase RuvA